MDAIDLSQSGENFSSLLIKESEANMELRRNLLDSVLKLTRVVNVSVIILVFLIFLTDTIGLFYYQLTTPRLITENVIMALIAGTVVQIVSMLVGINKNLFPEDGT